MQQQWKESAVLDELGASARGWATVTLGILERIQKRQFSLQDVYKFEPTLAQIFPNNHNIRPKLRQQLQVLRDMGFIEFLGGGEYALADKAARQNG